MRRVGRSLLSDCLGDGGDGRPIRRVQPLVAQSVCGRVRNLLPTSFLQVIPHILPPTFELPTAYRYAAKDTLDKEYASLQKHQKKSASKPKKPAPSTRVHGRRLKLSVGKAARRLSLRAAVAEAIFLIGLERNADVVP